MKGPHRQLALRIKAVEKSVETIDIAGGTEACLSLLLDTMAVVQKMDDKMHEI